MSLLVGTEGTPSLLVPGGGRHLGGNQAGGGLGDPPAVEGPPCLLKEVRVPH